MYIKASKMHLECLKISYMISHTTKHMSTRYGLSSIKHWITCDDVGISLIRCSTQINVVDNMCQIRSADNYVVNMTTQSIMQTPIRVV